MSEYVLTDWGAFMSDEYYAEQKRAQQAMHAAIQRELAQAQMPPTGPNASGRMAIGGTVDPYAATLRAPMDQAAAPLQYTDQPGPPVPLSSLAQGHGALAQAVSDHGALLHALAERLTPVLRDVPAGRAVEHTPFAADCPVTILLAQHVHALGALDGVLCMLLDRLAL